MKRSQQAKGARSGFGSALGASGGAFSGAAAGSALSYLAEPPSFSAVSDPNAVVSLKNVLKKDGTTKAKALEDLLQLVQAHPFEQGGGVDEALLEIWTQLYPRISIDNSRRVRELSHTLQFELLKSARKRMERHIPKVVGAWLSGLYDRDRVVARAANDGLSSFLTTPEKVSAFWSKCQAQILDYAAEAARETQDTLSDERTTTAEDAEAKYFRVITASLSLVLGLVQLDDGGVEKSRPKFDDYFAEEVVWKTITFKDPQVRKTVCQLLFACLERRLPYAESAKARQAFVTGGLKTNQSGSALEYVRALTRLSQYSPSIWAENPSDKKSPFTRLQSFIAKGSQGSPPKFWECLDQLLVLIPTDVLTLEASAGLLSSLKSGIMSRDEPRANTSFSWKCYVDAARRCLKALSDVDQLALAKEQLFPLFEQFLFSTSEEKSCIPLGPNALSILVEIHMGLVQSSSRLVEASAGEWVRLGAMLCANVSGSLPEVSKEYQASQAKIGEEGRRWFGLVGPIHGKLQELNNNLPDQTTGPSTQVITQCIMVLGSRNMKPFGAAQALEHALRVSPHLFTAQPGERLADFLQSSAEEDMDKVVRSASSRSLLSCLRIFGTIPGRQDDYAAVWKAWTQATLNLAPSTSRNSAITGLVSQEKAAPIAQNTPRLQDALCSQTREAVEAIGDHLGSSRELLEAAITHQALDASTSSRIASDMVTLLGEETQNAERILGILEVIAKRRPEIFSQQEAIHTELVEQLLALSEVGDSTISPRAARIRSLLHGQGQGMLPAVEIIQSNLERAGPQSLEISTLVAQAKSAADANVRWEDILPSTNVWMAELSPLMEQHSIDPSLSITSSIGGAVTLPRAVHDSQPSQSRVARDRKGRSIPTRMALYNCELLSAVPDGIELPRQFHVELLYLQCLSVQLASDQITCMSHDGLWTVLEDNDGISQAEELVTSSRSLLNKLIATATRWDDAAGEGISGVIRGLVDLTMKEAMELTTRGAYSARALSELLQALTQVHGVPSGLEERFLKPDILKAKPDTALLAAGLIAGLGESLRSSKAIKNFCNRLVSDVAGLTPGRENTMATLVLLTSCAQVYDFGGLPVANNRVVFAAKQLTAWTEDIDELDADDVYGSYWEKTMQFCVGLWERAGQHVLSEALPFMHSSLKLFKTLEGIQEPNDDLQDALRDFATAKSNGLVELLKLPREEHSQPMEIVDAMLCREIEKLPVARIPGPTDLFPLVASESRDIQTAAFNARLPDELLSLLLDPPTLDKFSDEALSLFPSSVRCYLLSWKLLFDAFSTSSFKIRNDFTEHLRTGDFVNPLLDFLFDVLGHSAAHPLNLDKENIGPQQIGDYDIKLADSEAGEQSMHWLLAHLFYLTLRYTPGLFRAWYMDCRSKQTRIAVESWTTKYFSPLIIADTLDGVQAWAESQESPASDEQELLVKVSKAAREVTAGYEVDESQAAIVIKVPSSYPIEGVTVAGLRRVAVTERKWQSWIMTTQGVITFSNGNIVDGLQVFRRNIVGALKGQSECAICYSIISADKRMPDKRCTTCKNLFHRTCLYKWFQSSSQNTCPLCRNPIDYLGADTAKRRGA
ncbi:E3 ubiquitin-protein ligase listerin [Tolypocladium capitatum]|uniref:E3 ubiquitin-protein ligase listerin n=1 Tax=Tolypocladium capitatum TaxID=45235 RepID=A0A2K3Q6J1_9HYPO|nr:E3 ubiquitin-protein ligase listerin [Tolypocladium capitatum]